MPSERSANICSMKVREREEARSLRSEEGMAITAIARRLCVAKSSVSLWTRDIELTESQRESLRKAQASHQAIGTAAMCDAARRRRLAAQEHGRQMARQGNPLHLAGCMLYWAEGTKGRNRVQLTNSDPHMLVYFVKFLRECYEVPDDRIRFTVNCHLNNGLSIETIETAWLERLQLPPGCVRQHTLNSHSSASKMTRRTLPHGTARIEVGGSTFIVQSIYGAIQEYAGMERAEWLD